MRHRPPYTLYEEYEGCVAARDIAFRPDSGFAFIVDIAAEGHQRAAIAPGARSRRPSRKTVDRLPWPVRQDPGGDANQDTRPR